jgi:[acyl-carrier-protein] S-malonyltransferase
MQDAADNMKEKIKLIEFKNPSKKIISNVTSKEIETSQIKNLLIKQIYSKVRWRESIMNINKQGVNTFIEIGPGKVLSGLSRRIAKENKSTSINSVKDIELILNESKK